VLTIEGVKMKQFCFQHDDDGGGGKKGKPKKPVL